MADTYVAMLSMPVFVRRGESGPGGVIDDLGRGANSIAVDVPQRDGLQDLAFAGGQSESFTHRASQPGRALGQPVRPTV
jgi:hypothetical protein